MGAAVRIPDRRTVPIHILLLLIIFGQAHLSQGAGVSARVSRKLLQCTTEAACRARCPPGNSIIYLAPQDGSSGQCVCICSPNTAQQTPAPPQRLINSNLGGSGGFAQPLAGTLGGGGNGGGSGGGSSSTAGGSGSGTSTDTSSSSNSVDTSSSMSQGSGVSTGSTGSGTSGGTTTQQGTSSGTTLAGTFQTGAVTSTSQLVTSAATGASSSSESSTASRTAASTATRSSSSG